jgi:hypothetical protein
MQVKQLTDGHLRGIATKEVNVRLHPFQSKRLIEYTSVHDAPTENLVR